MDSWCTLSFDLERISQLRIVPTDGDTNEVRIGGKLAPGYIVFAHQSLTTGMLFNVTPPRLGPLVAALMFLSPNARLTQGAGF